MKAPAFLLYTGDFLSSPDVQLMEAHEVGAHCLLLFNSWQSDRPGYLPNDEGRLRRTARLSVGQWAESRQLLLGKFPVAPDDPAQRYNPRLAAEAGKQRQHREQKARAGQASAAKRAAQVTQATGVENKPTPVEHPLPESPVVPPLSGTTSTPVAASPTPVAPPLNTRCENGQRKGNLSLSISRSSSLRSERGAAVAAKPAPQPVRQAKKPAVSPKPGPAPPALAEVQAYAADQYPGPAAQDEAAAFIDHFESNGWLVGGKTPMVSWRAAFRNWMRRRPQFQAAAGRAGAPPPTRARTAPKPADSNRWSQPVMPPTPRLPDTARRAATSDSPPHRGGAGGGVAAGHLPPQALDLEAAVLGAALLEAPAQRTLLALLPDEQVFHSTNHQQVYLAIRDLVAEGQQADQLTVVRQCRLPSKVGQ